MSLLRANWILSMLFHFDFVTVHSYILFCVCVCVCLLRLLAFSYCGTCMHFPTRVYKITFTFIQTYVDMRDQQHASSALFEGPMQHKHSDSLAWMIYIALIALHFAVHENIILVQIHWLATRLVKWPCNPLSLHSAKGSLLLDILVTFRSSHAILSTSWTRHFVLITSARGWSMPCTACTDDFG